MGRRASPWWSEREQAYYTRLGEVSPRTGRRKAVRLLDEAGRPVGRKDHAGKAAALGRLLADLDRAERSASGPTVAEVCRMFVAWQAGQGAADRTVADHFYHLTRFSKFEAGGVRYADRAAAAITPDDLWAVQDAGLGSIRHLFASVLACWRWASRPIRGRTPRRLIPAYPFEGLERPPAGSRAEALPWDVTRKLLRFARARARTMVPGARRARTRAAERLRVLCLTLIAHSGCRPFEAVQLEWAEVRWEERILAVGAGRDKGRRKGRAPRKPRRIALPPRLMQALASLRGWDQSHPVYAFLPSWSRSAGAPSVKEMIRWFREELKPAARAAGIAVPEEATMYWLRHDWQTTGLEVDSAEGVAAAAGNSPQVLLSTYDHTRNRRIRDVADKVGNARRKSARKPAG